MRFEPHSGPCLPLPHHTPGLAVAVVSGDSLLTSLHAARAVGIVGGPRAGKGKGKKNKKKKGRTVLVLDFDTDDAAAPAAAAAAAAAAPLRAKGRGKKGPGLAWFLAPRPHHHHHHHHHQEQLQQQQQGKRRQRMANFFVDHRLAALGAKYDLCAGGPALQAALARGGGIGQRCAGERGGTGLLWWD